MTEDEDGVEPAIDSEGNFEQMLDEGDDIADNLDPDDFEGAETDQSEGADKNGEVGPSDSGVEGSTPAKGSIKRRFWSSEEKERFFPLLREHGRDW